MRAQWAEATARIGMRNEDARPSFRWAGVCLDCANAEELATFYSLLLGWEIAARDRMLTV